MGFFRDISPVRAAADLKAYWFDQQEHKWRFLALSLACTFAVFGAFFGESGFEVEWKRPEVTWVTSFDPGRSDQQIAAENVANQEAKEKREAARLAREEERKAQYRRLAEQLGMDTE
ncbi:hypothetical protein [Sphingomonas sp. 35-24ZXX]|uniref:hypothetical protein n=1 Tax=Sphingomonas sp. 35-24ZXX TaxID=1545915 RepID=UPI00053BEAA4|nr:hypothetical protein [Sphingomonas sp. 35-24ZXX]